ncbi:MAG: hypothetical protein ACREJO_12090 [Phycisphaerales bacterium]
MPAILPRDPRQLVTFAQFHAPVWQQHAAELGLSPQQLQDLLAGTSEGAATAAAAQEARYASLGATQVYYDAAARLRDVLGACMATIHATAAASAEPVETYTTAQVPVPRRPGRSAGDPAQPENLRATLLWDGSLRLNWSARQPAGVTGVVTLVLRRLPGEGDTDFRLIDLVGGKTWTDQTLPPGTTAAEYQLQGRRGDRTGPLSNILSVPFGSLVRPQNTTTTAAKLAA